MATTAATQIRSALLKTNEEFQELRNAIDARQRDIQKLRAQLAGGFPSTADILHQKQMTTAEEDLLLLGRRRSLGSNNSNNSSIRSSPPPPLPPPPSYVFSSTSSASGSYERPKSDSVDAIAAAALRSSSPPPPFLSSSSSSTSVAAAVAAAAAARASGVRATSSPLEQSPVRASTHHAFTTSPSRSIVPPLPDTFSPRVEALHRQLRKELQRRVEVETLLQKEYSKSIDTDILRKRLVLFAEVTNLCEKGIIPKEELSWYSQRLCTGSDVEVEAVSEILRERTTNVTDDAAGRRSALLQQQLQSHSGGGGGSSSERGNENGLGSGFSSVSFNAQPQSGGGIIGGAIAVAPDAALQQQQMQIQQQLLDLQQQQLQLRMQQEHLQQSQQIRQQQQQQQQQQQDVNNNSNSFPSHQVLMAPTMFENAAPVDSSPFGPAATTVSSQGPLGMSVPPPPLTAPPRASSPPPRGSATRSLSPSAAKGPSNNNNNPNNRPRVIRTPPSMGVGGPATILGSNGNAGNGNINPQFTMSAKAMSGVPQVSSGVNPAVAAAARGKWGGSSSNNSTMEMSAIGLVNNFSSINSPAGGGAGAGFTSPGGKALFFGSTPSKNETPAQGIHGFSFQEQTPSSSQTLVTAPSIAAMVAAAQAAASSVGNNNASELFLRPNQEPPRRVSSPPHNYNPHGSPSPPRGRTTTNGNNGSSNSFHRTAGHNATRGFPELKPQPSAPLAMLNYNNNNNEGSSSPFAQPRMNSSPSPSVSFYNQQQQQQQQQHRSNSPFSGSRTRPLSPPRGPPMMMSSAHGGFVRHSGVGASTTGTSVSSTQEAIATAKQTAMMVFSSSSPSAASSSYSPSHSSSPPSFAAAGAGGSSTIDKSREVQRLQARLRELEAQEAALQALSKLSVSSGGGGGGNRSGRGTSGR